MFIRDYSLNVMADCSDDFYYACPLPRDFDSLSLWCLGC